MNDAEFRCPMTGELACSCPSCEVADEIAEREADEMEPNGLPDTAAYMNRPESERLVDGFRWTGE